MVDRRVIGRKLDQIEHHLERIRSLPDLSLEAFKNDAATQDIFLFNLTQAIQNCIDIATHIVSDEGWGMPGTQSEGFDILKEKGVIQGELAERLVSMVGFRNRVIHEYETLDLDIVYDIWRNRLRDIEGFCLAVVERFGL